MIFNTNVFKPSLKLLPSDKIVKIVQDINEAQVRNIEGEEDAEEEESASKNIDVTLNNFIKILTVTVPVI